MAKCGRRSSTTQPAISPLPMSPISSRLQPNAPPSRAPESFLGLQEQFSSFAGVLLPGSNILNNATIPFPPPPTDLNLPNSITIFPGGFPLYTNGVLIGAIGISGDGIDQDDIIGFSGAALFSPPPELRSDRVIFRGARLPYAKFPRNPNL